MILDEEPSSTELGSRQEPQRRSVLRASRLRWWFAWVAGFYSIWTAIQISGGFWERTLAEWPIALAMAAGSYVAGSTPMGGGTVGFPVLVLLFDYPAALGRNFALVIQSIGMTSAAFFVLCRRSPIEYRVALWCMAGSLPGIVAGTYLVAPLLQDSVVKLIFACLWASFGALTLVKNREICGFAQVSFVTPEASRSIGLLIGIFGGVTTALTGVGVDMLLYTALVLLYRMDLKVAVPTSVVVMAAASVQGSALHLWIGDLDSTVWYTWLAASPVVILGAPLGALFVSIIPRLGTLYFVSVLCLLQFGWALYEVSPSPAEWLLVAGNLTLAGIGFAWLYQTGRRRARLSAADWKQRAPLAATGPVPSPRSTQASSLETHSSRRDSHADAAPAIATD